MPRWAEIGAYSRLMEVYRKQTRKIIDSFLGRKIAFPECIAALNHALARRIQTLLPGELLNLRAVMLTNNETVMKEMEKRERHLAARRESYRKSKLK
jgi:hypothetical protein